MCVCALSVSVNNLQVYACWSLFWAALVTESEREAEELSIFSRGTVTEKICLGGTVITSLFSPPSSVPLSPHLLRIYTVSVYPSIYPSTASPVSIVRPKQSVWCALAVIYSWMPAHLGRIRFKVCAAQKTCVYILSILHTLCVCVSVCIHTCVCVCVCALSKTTTMVSEVLKDLEVNQLPGYQSLFVCQVAVFLVTVADTPIHVRMYMCFVFLIKKKTCT